MDLFWLAIVAVMMLFTLGLIALCDPPRRGEP